MTNVTTCLQSFILLHILGYYCSGAAEIPNPVGQVYGDVCYNGNYCPNGTDIPVPCPSGTFLNITGMQSVDDCVPCSPGKLVERMI